MMMMMMMIVKKIREVAPCGVVEDCVGDCIGFRWVCLFFLSLLFSLL